MQVTALFLTHIVARQQGKSPFFFSRFNFTRMKERGNTHYCFHCGGYVGFTPKKQGVLRRCDISKPTNRLDESGYDAMKNHDRTHANGVIGNAQRHKFVWDWLRREIPKNFPYVVNVPQV